MPLNRENTKTLFTQVVDFSKVVKKGTNGKKTEKVACQVRFIEVFQRSMFTLMFTQITRTEWLSSSTSFVEISRKIQALFQEDIL